jgi:hypothetical protein
MLVILYINFSVDDYIKPCILTAILPLLSAKILNTALPRNNLRYPMVPLLQGNNCYILFWRLLDLLKKVNHNLPNVEKQKK